MEPVIPRRIQTLCLWFTLTTAFCLWEAPAKVKPEELRSHPIRQARTWTAALDKPFADRFGPAPEGVVQYVRLDNDFHGWPDQPVSWRPTQAESLAVAEAVASLPKAVVDLVSPYLVGVFFVDGLGGSGYTETVDRTERGEELAFIVIDRAVLSGTGNAWATWRESTVFRQGAFRIEVKIADERSDDVAGAFRFILLHELGHVLGVTKRHHGSWNEFPRDVPFRFADIGWTPEGRPHADFSYFGQFRYYTPNPREQAANEMMPKIWANLASSRFPTLYATTGPFDDFAESFASYVHVIMLKAPWTATVYDGSRAVVNVSNSIADTRGAARRRYFDRLFAR